jgi:hypothetical protein
MTTNADRGIGHEMIDHIFSYHQPKDEAQTELLEKVREAVRLCAHEVKDLTPVCPEQTVAIRKLQEAMMLATASIVLHG